jgi:hypothetical protein
MARAHTRPPVARSAAIVAMAAALALNGCAARGSFFQEHGTAQARDRLAGPSESYVKYIKSLPVGSHVKVALRDGERIDAVLVAADDSGVLLQPRTRIPEPERHVDISEIATIELHTSHGMGVGKAILIGVAAGGAAILTILFVAIATGWD